jgi:predicted metalloprotease with PDZ domain
VGAPILTRFNLWLDLAAPRMWAQANGHLADPFARDRIGLQGYMDGDQFRVMHVRLGSPASQAGLTTQDRVVAINGRPAAELIEELKYQAPAGRAYVLTLADGRQVSLTAADFY